MKIAYITPGSGGSFYCQNCFRDVALLHAFQALGHDVVQVPLYLPVKLDHDQTISETPVFYGAINLYLKEKVSLYRQAPVWLERVLDSQVLLNLAARFSGSTRPEGLEEMTLSMLEGEGGRQASELDHLVQFLQKEIAPDVVHLSNALLLGLAHRLKQDLGVGIVCSLQDENEWVDPMEGSYQEQVWNLMARKARDVDLFITSSRYYAEKSQRQLDIPADKIDVIPGGVDLDGYLPSTRPLDPPVVGYLCRMSAYFGLGILVDAFIQIKKNSRFSDLRLHLCGGYNSDDKSFVNAQMKKMARHGFDGDVQVFHNFEKDGRVQFLKTLTLLSVPVPSGEAFGAYQVEALAAGVPVVQPNVGCYPEFVEVTNGGIIYEPNTAEELAGAIVSLLEDPEQIQSLSAQGRPVVLERFSMDNMARNIARLYKRVA